MIVFQVKGKSHRLSTLKVKEKDVIKNFSTYSTKYTEDTEALASQAKIDQSPIQSTVYELLYKVVVSRYTIFRFYYF